MKPVAYTYPEMQPIMVTWVGMDLGKYIIVDYFDSDSVKESVEKLKKLVEFKAKIQELSRDLNEFANSYDDYEAFLYKSKFTLSDDFAIDAGSGVCAAVGIIENFGVALKAAMFRKFTKTEAPQPHNWYTYPVEYIIHGEEAYSVYRDSSCNGSLWLNPKRWELVDFLIVELEALIKFFEDEGH